MSTHLFTRGAVKSVYMPCFMSFLLSFLTLQACSGIPISYYDSTTYTQLTCLKAEATTLVDTFDFKKLEDNQSKIDEVMMSFKKSYEYEKGKGEPNSDTLKQIELIKSLFEEDVKNYRTNKPGELGDKYFSQEAIVLGQAFDIAISTENLKNKDKR